MIRPITGIPILLLLTCHLAATAQQQDKTGQITDTVTTSDTIVVGAGSPAEDTHLDTSYYSAPEERTNISESPVLRSVPDSTISRWQRDPKFDYANNPDYWSRKPPRKPDNFSYRLNRFLSGKAFEYTLLTLLAGLLIYAVVRIAMENKVTMFARRKKKSGGLADEEGDLPKEEDIEERLRHFLQSGEKKQATRYLYLKTLYLLDQRQIIRLHAESTNQEYLRQLRGNPAEPAFKFLTRAYEMVWYGDFVLSESSFQRLHEYFTDFYKTLQA
jgi:hypothetical protein